MQNTIKMINFALDTAISSRLVLFPDEYPAYYIPSRNFDIPYQSIKQYPWEKGKEEYTSIELMSEDEKIEIIYSFASKVMQDSKDMEPEFYKVVNEKFWDLI